MMSAVSFTETRLPGQYYDSETGLNYVVQRYLDTGSGRFITSDRTGLAGGLNTYSYALQNPINYYDPNGEAAQAAAAAWGTTGAGASGLGALGPAAGVAGAGLAGWQFGSWVYGMYGEAFWDWYFDDTDAEDCPPDEPDCQEHFTRCLGTSLADEPGSVHGSSRCGLCRDQCVRNDGIWPDIAITGGRSVRCDYWNF